MSLAIMNQEANSSLSAIKTMGFESALRVAHTRAMLASSLLEEARRNIKLYKNFLADARFYEKSSILNERFLLLAKFYRILAHKIYLSYLMQNADNENVVIDNSFIQEI